MVNQPAKWWYRRGGAAAREGLLSARGITVQSQAERGMGGR